MLLLVLVAALASCVQGAAVRHEYHAPLTLAPLTSYSSLAVTRWRIPQETRLATWTVQTSAPPGCGAPANITM